MRSSEFGRIHNACREIGLDKSLKIVAGMALIRDFEAGLIDAVEKKLVTYPVYLTTGQEAIPAAMSLAVPEFYVFAQHRCHGIYLALGGDPRKLRDELLGLPSGSSGGRAGSNCLQCLDGGIRMFGHHGLIGENVSLAAGAALGSGHPVVAFFGDGAMEEDYVLSSLGFAATHRLPVLFVCEDNDLSILTTVATRRSWNAAQVARSFGIQSVEMADDPFSIYLRAMELKDKLPVFMNIHTCRERWHVGVGQDGPPEWNRFEWAATEIENAFSAGEQVRLIRDKSKQQMEQLWDRKQLPIPSAK